MAKADLGKIDEAVLALLYLGLHEDVRAWKSFDWDAMSRLHARGHISDPASKAKSIQFTEEGLRASEQAFQRLFCQPAA
jgi:hypothetical protein